MRVRVAANPRVQAAADDEPDMSGSQLIYGLHAVQSLLKRHPDRVLQLRLTERAR